MQSLKNPNWRPQSPGSPQSSPKDIIKGKMFKCYLDHKIYNTWVSHFNDHEKDEKKAFKHWEENPKLFSLWNEYFNYHIQECENKNEIREMWHTSIRMMHAKMLESTVPSWPLATSDGKSLDLGANLGEFS